jgi:hypothetical protein
VQAEFLNMSSSLEKRVAELERKLATIEARRAKLIPPELDNDANVQALLAANIKSAVAGWRLCLSERDVNVAQAHFQEAQRKTLQQLEEKTRAAKLSESAEIVAVLQYIEKHGVAPEGYELVEDNFETTFSRPPQPGG